MCVLSIKVPVRKKSGNVFNDPRTHSSGLKNDQKEMKNVNSVKVSNQICINE